jgi:hypothetical protein
MGSTCCSKRLGDPDAKGDVLFPVMEMTLQRARHGAVSPVFASEKPETALT